MGWAAEHLGEGERREIARGLFQVTEERGAWMNGLCPLHADSRASFGYNAEEDHYLCHAGCPPGDLVALWCRVHGTGGKEGFLAFLEAFGLRGSGRTRRGGKGGGNLKAQTDAGHDGRIPPGPPLEKGGGRAPGTVGDGGGETVPGVFSDLEAAWAKFPPLPDSWAARLSDLRGWSLEMIRGFDLRLQTFFPDKKGGLSRCRTPERVAIPILDPNGNLKNIRLYKPKPKEKEAKILSWGRGFGSARLFPAVPPVHSDGPVILCEGESDTLCALSHGLNAITQTSKTKAWKARDLKHFAGLSVVVAYDADRAGVNYADWAGAALHQEAASVRILEWPDWMGRLPDGSWPEKHGQDLTDFFVKHGREVSEFLELVEGARVWEPPGGGEKKSPPAPLFQRGELAAPAASGGEDGDPGNWGEGTAAPAGELVGLGVEVGEVLPCSSLFFEVAPGGRVSFKPRLLAQEILRRTPILSDPETGILYQWNGAYWEAYEESLIRKMALRLLGDESMRARAEDATYQVRHLAAMPHGRTVNDRDGWMCVKNGMLHLATLKLAPHDPDAYCTYSLPVTFDPELPRPAVFERYLAETVRLPGPIKLLQEFTGSVFMRSARFTKCLFLLGLGSDGKSTFLKVLRRLVGTANHSAVSFKDLEDKFARVALYNKLLNTGTEISEDLLESSTFKAIVSGDPISARLLYGNLFEFMPYVKLAFAGNDFPRVRDNSDGFYRRILLVKFRRQFMGKDDDKFLEDKLAKELDSIFLWALAGYRRLLDHGWTDCAETASLLHHERRVNDPVLAFLEDCCEFGGHLSVKKEELYSKYQKWATANGLPYKGSPRFFEALKKSQGQLGQSRPRVNGERQYMIHGVGMVDDAQ